MARIILHIGTHKTATTTIQNVFYRNAALLARHGILYPKLGKPTGHHGLSGDWYRDLPKNLQYSGGSRAAWRDLARRYASGDHTVFLSSETLSVGHPNGAPDYGWIRETLAPFEEVRVLCVLREQWQFMQSLFLEVGKKAVPPQPDELVRKALAGDYCTGMWTDYQGFYDRLLQSFAPQEIRFLDFDTARRAEGGILGAVLREAGCALRAEELDQGNGRANLSPPPLPAWAASVAARPEVAPDWLVAEAQSVFQLIFGQEARSCLFTREEQQKLDRHFAPLNAALAAGLAPLQPGFAISRTPSEKLDHLIFRNRIKADFWMRMTRRATRKVLTQARR
ncbi:hypothetical protein CKO11_13985 [Rhodobacter sp. TJ_12]|uniref:hypothetical protein n=1 Tax=Rhodobacter sp. TJ_12 TaxID=2029399 RepID=UPI001CC0A75B|nr:hypothetical protein [Rhodobacter sp. TJ_12]MBZ4023568.1 hypothetical protein [Rhodobacter sp. TJ_12]